MSSIDQVIGSLGDEIYHVFLLGGDDRTQILSSVANSTQRVTLKVNLILYVKPCLATLLHPTHTYKDFYMKTQEFIRVYLLSGL